MVMDKLIIKRFPSTTQGTFGVLLYDNGKYHATLELPWNDNRPSESCILPGFYTCKRFSSAKHPDTWEVTGVPHRTAILFHVANTIYDLRGCIGLGMWFGSIGNQQAIVSSKQAFQEFLEITKDWKTFQLEITEI